MPIYRIYGRSRAAAGANERMRFPRPKLSRTVLLHQFQGILYNYIAVQFNSQ